MRPEFESQQKLLIEAGAQRREASIKMPHIFLRKLVAFAQSEYDQPENLIVEGVMRVIADRENDKAYLDALPVYTKEVLKHIQAESDAAIDSTITDLENKLALARSFRHADSQDSGIAGNTIQ